MALRGSQDTWRKDSFDALRQAADFLATGPDAALFADYIAYLNLRARGLRKPSLAAAGSFVSTYQHDPFEIRQRICWSLIQTTERYWNRWPAVETWLFPGSIAGGLFAPMFKEWRIRAPKNANAWLYQLEWNFGLDPGEQIAFMLEPENPRCQYAALQSVHRSIDYCIHEFDHCGYVLTTPDDFRDLLGSLMAVTNAMGANLSAEILPYLSWLQALSTAYREIGSGHDLRDLLAQRSIGKRPMYYLSVKSWFRQLPDVVRG